MGLRPLTGMGHVVPATAHNFTLPRIRSESPAFDLHHPDITAAGIQGDTAAKELR